ncbi:tRNA (adenosine(37)-N6)-dimethylallyltransferase MiaA [Paenisporosarcina cavernae]|uniref:tRNA dimethylallyltransferase n=1 Tax=Paenisporosarcina cavernae TaxID=2320858 RepID=A0A385YRF9_9BACL|nr:tRNA (adenosine(37)-N6)-dimethylallyltransferase MiaA [Paenisporosarcina cavernae]AYC29319.1 tRNA (adenosine(37)-N6)-dimethylallyltransferase MiaA [Paenisporosarcina cavernae]
MSTLDLVAIVGPTAVGKTDLSIELATKWNGEIINGDSMQVYEELSIGTAKITEEEMKEIPHHLFDIKKPTESFSVAEYQQLVREKAREIKNRGKVPILVGGTGLYVQAVLYDFHFTETKIDASLRSTLYEELEEFGPVHMHQKLQELDKPSADSIHPNNTRRVIRALEMILFQGEKRSADNFQQGKEEFLQHLVLGLNRDRDELYERINQRVNWMIEKGLEQEVRNLQQKGIREGQAMQAIGYKEMIRYLDGELTLPETIKQIQQNSRRYAKRQLTYFRNKMDITWIDASLPINRQVAIADEAKMKKENDYDQKREKEKES